MYCSKCGAQLPDNIDFCTNCGAPTKETNAAQNSAPVNSNAKSKLAAGLLALFLGWIGVHFYYLDENEKFKNRLILGLCGFITCGITSLIGEILGIIEGIKILTGEINVDGNGVSLTD